MPFRGTLPPGWDLKLATGDAPLMPSTPPLPLFASSTLQVTPFERRVERKLAEEVEEMARLQEGTPPQGQ